jgi:hypothetical protein
MGFLGFEIDAKKRTVKYKPDIQQHGIMHPNSASPPTVLQSSLRAKLHLAKANSFPPRLFAQAAAQLTAAYHKAGYTQRFTDEVMAAFHPRPHKFRTVSRD